MSCMSQNFPLFHVSNLSVLNLRIVLLMCPEPVSQSTSREQHFTPGPRCTSCCCSERLVAAAAAGQGSGGDLYARQPDPHDKGRQSGGARGALNAGSVGGRQVHWRRGCAALHENAGRLARGSSLNQWCAAMALPVSTCMACLPFECTCTAPIID